MLQLVYISTARHVPDEAELQQILEVSRRNNGAADITGLLVVGGRRFLQALEGPTQAVTATYQRIRSDPRHFGLVELSRREVEAREFGAWSMGYERGADAPTSGLLRSSVEALVAPVSNKSLRAQLTGFAEIHSRVALQSTP